MAGIRITISGPPKSGKTTVVTLVRKFLRAMGLEVTVVRAEVQRDDRVTEEAVKRMKADGLRIEIHEVDTRRDGTHTNEPRPNQG